MTIASEITRIKNNIASAYTALSDKGATMPVTQDSANLATTVTSVPSWYFCGIYGWTSINYTTGEVSSFSPSSYMSIDLTNVDLSVSEYVFKFTTGTDINNFQNIIEASPALELYIENGELCYWCSSESMKYTCGNVSTETTYWVKLIMNNGDFSLSYSTDGETYTGTVSGTNTLMTIANNRIKIGGGLYESRYFRGSIFLADSYIKLNGNNWFMPAVRVVL